MNYQDVVEADAVHPLPGHEGEHDVISHTPSYESESFSEGWEDELNELDDSEAYSLSDSDDEYLRATSRKLCKDAFLREQSMPTCVLVDMATAVQRGCVLYALPAGCEAYECSSKAQHFQTMDCLALVPPASLVPCNTNGAAPGHSAATTAAGVHGHSMGASVSPGPSRAAGGGGGTAAVSTAAVSTAAAAVTSSGTHPCNPALAAAAAVSAQGSATPAAPPYRASEAMARDEGVEILIGDARRLSILRLGAPPEPGPPREVCSCTMEAHHYSLAVSPCGRFIAAGSERGFVFILAYVREVCGGGEGASASTSTSTSTSGRGHPQPVQPASLTPCATFCVPQARHYWGMNNMVRFGSFGGADHLIVATQDRAIYFFNLPPWDGSAATLQRSCPPSSFLCTGLPRWTVGWRNQQQQQPAEQQQGVQAGREGEGGHPEGQQQQHRRQEQEGERGEEDVAVGCLPQPQQIEQDRQQQQQQQYGAGAGPDFSGSWDEDSVDEGDDGTEGHDNGGGDSSDGDGGDSDDGDEDDDDDDDYSGGVYDSDNDNDWISDGGSGGADAGADRTADIVREQPPELRCPNAAAWRYWQRHPSPFAGPPPNVCMEHCLLVDPSEGPGRQRDNPLTTCGVTGFLYALNAAVPSSDGRWLAVGCDAPLLYLLPADPDYPSKPVEVLLAPLPRTLSGRLAPGCQYIAFNPACDKLAASFDSLFSVLVYDIPRRQLLFSLGHPQWRAPLALGFAPGHPSLLLHATDRDHLVVVDVEQPRTTLTRITLKSRDQRALQKKKQQLPGFHGGSTAQGNTSTVSASRLGTLPPIDPHGRPRAPLAWTVSQSPSGARRRNPISTDRRPRINGLVVTPDNRILVATKEELLSFQLLLPNSPWSRCVHRHMPATFKAAVRALLLSSRSYGGGDGVAADGATVAEAAKPEPLEDGGAAKEATVVEASHGSRPTGLWSLPGDAVEAIIAVAARDRLAWVHTDAADVLAFPSLDFWEAPGRAPTAAASMGYSRGHGAGGDDEATEWNSDPWDTWHTPL